MLLKIAVLCAILTTSLVAARPQGDAHSLLSRVSDRRLMSEDEEFAAKLLSEVAEMQKEMPDSEEWRAPVIDQHCNVEGEVPFYTVDSSSYPGCFFTCAVIEYCDFFTYEAINATCSVYHSPEVIWTDDSPLFCWGVDKKQNL